MSFAAVESSTATEITPTANNITPNKRGVQFATPLTSEQLYDGVTEEERDDVWFRRMDYVEFVENELRRRELLNAIERGEETMGKNNKKLRRRASDTTEAEEEGLTHHYSRRMVSRSFSTGPKVTRRRKLPSREKNNDLEVSNHQAKNEKIGSMRRKFRNAKAQPQSDTTKKATTPATDGEAAATTTAAVDGKNDKKEDPKQSEAAFTATTIEGNDSPASKNEPKPAIEGGTSPPQALVV